VIGYLEPTGNFRVVQFKASQMPSVAFAIAHLAAIAMHERNPNRRFAELA
jgi:hypothetical protein